MTAIAIAIQRKKRSRCAATATVLIATLVQVGRRHLGFEPLDERREARVVAQRRRVQRLACDLGRGQARDVSCESREQVDGRILLAAPGESARADQLGCPGPRRVSLGRKLEHPACGLRGVVRVSGEQQRISTKRGEVPVIPTRSGRVLDEREQLSKLLAFVENTPATRWNDWYLAALRADALLFTGNPDDAAKTAGGMLELATKGDSARTGAAELIGACTFAWSGKQDAAVDLLTRLATDVPGLSPAEIARQPLYTTPLRDNARFAALVQRLEAEMAATDLH